MRRPDRHRFSCALAWMLCSALYLWTASGVTSNDHSQDNLQHHYDYLVDGFLSGQLHLSVSPSKELLALADPLDPAQNDRYRLGDASLYQGRYYLYFGPTPALLLLLPWKAITGHHLPQWLATAVFSSAGVGALALLLAGLRRRYFSAVSPGQLFFAILLAGHVSWLPVILRRAAFWELSIAAAAALLWWSLFFLWKYHESGGRRRWALAAGFALAFALGARPTYVFTAGFIALLFALPFAPTWPLRVHVRRLLPVTTPLVLGGIALLAYNYLRFGQLFEFGQRYQLWGDAYSRGVSFFHLAHLPFNFRLYFFSLPEFSPYFPFFRPVWPDSLPAGYLAAEDMHGLLFALPVHLLGVIALWRAYRQRHDAGRRPLCLLALAAAGSSLLAGAVLFCFAGACSRYITELVAGWSVLTGLGFFAACSAGGTARRAAGLRLLTGVAAVWSLLYVWLASFEFRGLARTTGFYRIVAEALNYPSDWAARRAGQAYGPVAIDIALPPQPAAGSAVLLAAGVPGMMNQLLLERVAPDQLRLRLVTNNLIMVETPVLHHRGPVVHVVCQAPWLYPPAAHPYWRTYADPAERLRRQTLLDIQVDGVSYARRSTWGFDATSFEPFVRTGTSQPPACAWVVDKPVRLEAPAR